MSLDKAEDENKLIDVLYETAVNPVTWPNVYQSLIDSFEYIESQYTNLSNAIIDNNVPLDGIDLKSLKQEYQTFSRIVPHIRRSLEVNKRVVEYDRTNRSINNILSCIPLSILIIDHNRKLIGTNETGDKLLKNELFFHINDGIIKSNDKDIELFIQNAVCNTSTKIHYSTKKTNCDENEVSLIATKLDKEGFVALFISQSEGQPIVSSRILQSLYGFTETEAKICQSLVEGKTLEDIALARDKSIHTIRTQLKTVLRKTNSNKQTTLITKLLTSPAGLLSAFKDNDSDNKDHKNSQYGILILKDGRKVGYSQHGDMNGYPVILCHSLFGSRYEIPSQNSILIEQKIKLIIVERPGYGLSDNLDFLSYKQWTKDLAEVLEWFNIDKFSVIGFSCGSYYAMAAASSFPNRVQHVTAVSMVPQVSSVHEFGEKSTRSKLIVLLAKYMPQLFKLSMYFFTRNMEKNPERFSDLVDNDYDKKIFTKPEVLKIMTKNCEAIAKGNGDAIYREINNYLAPSELDFKAITCPATIWVGNEDGQINQHLFNSMLDRFTTVKVHRLDNVGHILWFEYWEYIIGEFLPVISRSNKSEQEEIALS